MQTVKRLSRWILFPLWSSAAPCSTFSYTRQVYNSVSFDWKWWCKSREKLEQVAWRGIIYAVYDNKNMYIWLAYIFHLFIQTNSPPFKLDQLLTHIHFHSPSNHEIIVYKSKNSASLRGSVQLLLTQLARFRFPRCKIHGPRQHVIHENRRTRMVRANPLWKQTTYRWKWTKMKKEKRKEKKRSQIERFPISWNSWKFVSIPYLLERHCQLR